MLLRKQHLSLWSSVSRASTQAEASPDTSILTGVEKPEPFLHYSAQTKESFTCFYFQVFILLSFNLELTTENIRHKGT